VATFTRQKSGSWRVQVRRKGRYLGETFRRHKDAEEWALDMERRIDRGETPNGRSRVDPTTVAHLIDLHVDDMKAVGKAPRRSKAAVLEALKTELGRVRLKDLTRERLIEFGKLRAKAGAGPVTLSIDVGYIKTIIVHAAAVHGLELSLEQVDLARAALKRLGLVGRGRERDRRPSQDELDRICAYAEVNPLQVIPLARIVRFAVATAMRQEEISKLVWADFDEAAKTIMVRDRKDPRNKTGNDHKIPLLDATGYDAMALLQEQRAACSNRQRAFPYNGKSVGAAFHRVCKALKIADLHFHDLRHEGTSRLFEAGFDIPRVALVTGHKDWKMLRRYTNLKPIDLHNHIAKRKPTPDGATAPGQAAFSAAMALIVEDPALGRAARFRGTPVLVNPIAQLLGRGVSEGLILSDFPDLTTEMLAAAKIYAAVTSVRPQSAIGF
jgi:integrase/uncharacterized protein (DUF433 family)